jgi:hypothetical protein
MKRKHFLVLVVGFLMIFQLSQAQNNFALIDTTKLWTSMEWWPWYPGNWNHSYFNKINGDTVIEGQNYLKIWQSEDEYQSNWYLHGFIRKDTSGNIFARSVTGNEGLIYNFNLEIDQTFEMDNPFYGYSFEATVINVDSVLVEPSGFKRKRIAIVGYYPEYPEYWIEGIGSTTGFLFSGLGALSLTGSAYTLLCQWEDDFMVYDNELFDLCFGLPTSLDETPARSVTILIYPNPVKNTSFIEVLGFPGYEYIISISDVMGNIVFQNFISDQQKIPISNKLFNSGIYLLMLQREGQMIQVQKFIVQ